MTQQQSTSGQFICHKLMNELMQNAQDAPTRLSFYLCNMAFHARIADPEMDNADAVIVRAAVELSAHRSGHTDQLQTEISQSDAYPHVAALQLLEACCTQDIAPSQFLYDVCTKMVLIAFEYTSKDYISCLCEAISDRRG